MIEKIKQASHYLRQLKKDPPLVGIVLGSGLGPYTQEVQESLKIPYEKIPHFLQTTVDGHSGQLILGKINQTDVAVLQGRFHAYEGYNIQDVVFPIRVLADLGIKHLILTNAAGGINESFVPGDLVLIEDHINLSGQNPLVGPNDTEMGCRFPDMTFAYNRHLTHLFIETAQDLKFPLKLGVYCYLLGPSYETPAEIRMLRHLGADMVGMSTVPETIAAVHRGLQVAGISCITNMAAGMTNQGLSHDEVGNMAKKVQVNFSSLLNGTINKIKDREKDPSPI